ncbi:YciI family protein [Pseudomonas fluorescens]|nr:hypothetical protein [Pseudomonas fluorescens]WLH75892.1 hypothetical protein PSH70_10610 [Pseudomonas fluorescens]
MAVAVAGPLLGADGTPLGSLMGVGSDDQAHLQRWLATAPFTRNG